MVGASAGPENFKTMKHGDLVLFQGKQVPFGQNGGLNSGIGNFIHERRDVNANTGSTGTLTRGSGFAEADLAMDADFCGDITIHLTRAALVASAGATTYGAPYFRDNELYESIEKVQVRHEGNVVFEITGADMLKMFNLKPYDERAKWNRGMGANMSVGERRIRASASCDLYGPLILPWSVKNTLKEALPLRALRSPVTLRFYFTALANCVIGPLASTATVSGGALSGLSLRQDNYHVEADVANAVALSVARGSYQVPYMEFLRQGAVSVTAAAYPTATTTTIQLTNFKRHAFAVEVEIEYSDHLQGVVVDNVEKYSLPATYVRVLSGNKQINVEEVYTPAADCVTSPVASLRQSDNAALFKNKPANQIRNIVALCPLKSFDACLRGEFNNMRALQLYQDLSLQVVTPGELAYFTNGALYRGAHEFRAVGPNTDQIAATALTMTVVAYSANALLLKSGKLVPLFSI